MDAFQYFFGRSAQPAPRPEAKSPEKKLLDAFDYLFRKKSKAGDDEPAKESAKPPVS